MENEPIETNDTEGSKKYVTKSNQEEIRELRFIVEHMKKEINSLKQHICPNVQTTNMVPSSNKNSRNTTNNQEQNIQSKTPSTEARRQSSVREVHDRNTAVKENKNTCNKCEEIFKTQKSLDVHVKEKHERVYKCDLCVFQSKSVITLEQHKEDKHNTLNKCMKCKKTFLNEDMFRKHIEIHEVKSRMEEFNCDTCDFQNTKRKALKDHLEASPGHKPSQKNYECKDCKEVFRSYYNLMNHRSSEHPTTKACRYFKQGTCNFSAEDCWYAHAKTSSSKDITKEAPGVNEDFQMIPKNLPPDMNMLINQLINVVSKNQN